MNYTWRDYTPDSMDFVEGWLDEAAVRSTGLEDGFRDFYNYWAAQEGYRTGENYWCKVACRQDMPVGIIACALYEGTLTIMEILVAPELRGTGAGRSILTELHSCPEILGFPIWKSEAVIFPDNLASQKAFEQANFHLHHIYADGSAMLYVREG